MVENLLAKELRDYLAERFRQYGLPAQGGNSRRVPQIVNGYLPPKRSGKDDDFPFVLVRVQSGKTVHDATTAEVLFIVGCYSEDFDGHEYCLNVMAEIRNALFSLPNATLSDKYEFRSEFSWSLVADQPWPYWELRINTQWVMVAPPIDADDYLALGGNGYG